MTSWLKSLTNFSVSIDKLMHQLTMAGLEVHALDEEGSVLEVELTPNRSDCLSALGLAREISTLFNLPLPSFFSPAFEKGGSSLSISHSHSSKVEVLAPKACPCYSSAVIRGLNNTVPLPLWMKERLNAGGIDSISPIVDISNYVMLELGQPLHAFSLEKLHFPIKVRMALKGESLTLLNGNIITLDETKLVITDENNVLALAGVMGGLHTAVNAETQDIFLEAAHFNPVSLAGTAREYNLATDSSLRFERGVDPDLPQKALTRAIELLLEICGGTFESITEVVHESHMPTFSPVFLRTKRIKQLLGVELSFNEIEDILTRLHFSWIKEKEGWLITPPSYRFDIQIESDVIEEIGRLYGYHRIPLSFPHLEQRMPPSSEKTFSLSKCRSFLTALGYTETITYSFISEKINTLLQPDLCSLKLINPLSPELESLRTSLIPGLFEALRYNCNRKVERLKLFEIGHRFFQEAELPLLSFETSHPVKVGYSKNPSSLHEENILAGMAYGYAYPQQWGVSSRLVDFYDIKHDLMSLFDFIKPSLNFVETNHPSFHPGQTADIYIEKKKIGYLGVLHPEILKKLNLNISPILFEISLDTLKQREIPSFKEISKFPSIIRDLAFMLPIKIKALDIKNTIQQTCGSLLKSIDFFDVYQGKNIQEGFKSIALRLHFSSDENTLVDEEINPLIDKTIQVVTRQFKAVLRDF